MALDLEQFRSKAGELARRRVTRKIGIWFAVFLVATGIIGGLIAPPLVKQKLSSELSKSLHREVSIQGIRINPYAMSVRIKGFLMKERRGSATAVSFDELYVNLELLSLFQLGIVLNEIRLVNPYINLIRNEDRTYNFNDLLEEFLAKPSSGPTPRFSLNNIQVIDGKIDFDDRPEKTKHTVTDIRIGIPFISSMRYHTDTKVQPAFGARVNGTPMEITGETKPFKESLETILNLEITDLQIPKYLEYSPVELRFNVPSGKIDGKLRLSFTSFKDKASNLTISGTVGLEKLVVLERENIPLLNLPSFGVEIDSLDIFGNKASVKTVRVQAPELYLTRSKNGALNLASLIPVAPKKSEPAVEKNTAPFGYSVGEIQLTEGKLHFTDQVPEKPFRTILDAINLDVKDLSNAADAKANIELSFKTDAEERFSHSGTLRLTPLAAEGKVEISGGRLKRFYPYYQSALNLEVEDGLLDLTTAFFVDRQREQADTRFFDLNASLRSVRLKISGEVNPLWRIPLLTVKETSVDVGKRRVAIGELASRDAVGMVRRDPDGKLNYARLVRVADPEPEVEKPAEDGLWRVDTKRLVLDRFSVSFEDNALSTPAKTLITQLSAKVENLSNAKDARGNVTIRARINEKGSISVSGPLGTNPLVANLKLDSKAIDLVPFQPYFGEQVNMVVTAGEISASGKVELQMPSNAPLKVAFGGDVNLTNFSSIDKPSSQDLLKWKSLFLSGIQSLLDPLQVSINEISLSDFYSRLMLSAEGKLNLKELVATKKDSPEAKEAAAPQTPASTAGKEAAETQINIGKVTLQGGNIHFSDFFIKPNYSANLTGVGGSVSALSAQTAGDVELRGKVDNAAPLEITGKVNPLGKDLFLDIKASAKDIELSPLTPYSGKYAGYGIEKGKLSVNVKYLVENRKLSAENNIYLNQLTFGERVESPDATKLPVLLAMALLKDRNGVIDINLPISGSLDDPQFSVGGIIFRVLLNLITKAVTSPFALLAAVFGGGSEELSYIEFDYGRAKLPQSAEGKLKTLAKALNDRPGLKLEITGRLDPVNDREGLKGTQLERKVKAQKLKELVRKGTSPGSVDDIKIESSEYPERLKAAYREETFPKPRNLIGMAKDLPVPEMEKLMLTHAQATDEDLRQLANQRAQVVKDYLLSTGQVTTERLFIVAAQTASQEGKDKEKEKGKESRVDFSLK